MAKIGLIQMTSGIDPADNARAVDAAVREAAARGAELILTPEMTGLLDSDKKRLAANARPADDDPTLATASRAARETGTWVLVGSVPIPTGEGHFANRAFLFDGAGVIAATYDKIHLFDVDLPNGERYRESATYVSGTALSLTQTPVGKLGLSICYDVRFPHLYRALAQAGADLIAVPAAFTRTTGKAHWHTLLTARAIETGCYILAPAQTGIHEDGRSTFGHSLVVAPWGDILCDMGDAPGVAIVDIDLQQVADARARVPAWHANQSFGIGTK